MSNENGLAVTDGWTPERVELVRKTVATDCTPLEFELFMYACKKRRLDPLARQLFPVKRNRKKKDKTGKDVGWESYLVIQTSIDAARLIAHRVKDPSGNSMYQGQTMPELCGTDGIWTNVWIHKEVPMAARVGVYRKDAREATYGIAYYEACVQRFKGESGQEGEPTEFWRGKKAVNQLAKCAEMAALRKAFPEDLGDLYIQEEMAQAESAEQETKREEAVKTGDFADNLPDALKAKLAAFGYDNKAKIKSICDDAGLTLEGLEVQVKALELMATWSDPVKNQVKFAGFKNVMEVRRMVVKYGCDMRRITAMLNGEADVEVIPAAVLPLVEPVQQVIPEPPKEPK